MVIRARMIAMLRQLLVTPLKALLYAITAPGVDIDSANAYYGKTQDKLPGKDQRPMCSGGEQEEFCGMSGTSQATPMVSGAAMLVQQKFGFLGGAQIADVLLTTANNDFKAPKLMLKYLAKGHWLISSM